MNQREKHRIPGVIAYATLALIVAASYTGIATVVPDNQGFDRRGPETYSVGLFGDMPYNALGRSQYHL